VTSKIVKGFAVLGLAAVVLLAYNVIRHIVIWSPVESISFESDRETIGCMFAKPDDADRYPAVLQLLGSGPENSSGPGYRISVKNALRHGFAVLVCDKRGVGASSGNFDTATFAEFAEDAKNAVHYLALRPDVDPSRIGLLTTSESGWYAPQVAVETGQVAFIANRVGPPLPWMDTVLWEVRNEFLEAGIDESGLAPLLEITERRWRFYREVGKHPELSDGPERAAIDAELLRLRTEVPGAGELLPEKAAKYDPDFYRSYAIDASYDPPSYLRQLDIPLLYVFSGADVNIPTEKSVAFLEKFRKEYGGTIDIHVYPGLDHPMATWRGFLHGGYPPDYLSRVGKWIQSKSRDLPAP